MSIRLKGRSIFYIVMLAALVSALFISILLGLIIVVGAVVYYVWKGRQAKRVIEEALPIDASHPSEDAIPSSNEDSNSSASQQE